MKRCAKCGETKPLDDFTTSKRYVDGHVPECKTCRNAAQRRNYSRNAEQRRATSRSWLNANREKARKSRREWMREWRKQNPEKAKAASRENSRRFRKANPDYFRDRYWSDPEPERAIAREVMRRDRLLYPERERERRRRYRERNLETVRNRERANTHHRRALKAQTANSILGGYSRKYMVDYIATLLTQPCDYCGDPGDTLDHVVPLSRGGPHIPANLAAACFSCNSSKCDQLLSEWNGRLRRSSD